ncbi:MAG: putative metal-binding motif-containing protein [Sandaracinaceae bacterium]|nr:putative metal-binding motif-containing protein [Sandaracinaceae bacterium]
MPRRAWLLALVLTSGCADSTALLVEITSPLAVPGEVDALDLVVRGDNGNVVERRYDLDGTWPQTVSIRPGAMERGGVTITVTASRGGAFVARRVVRSAFVPGVQTRVAVAIGRDCVGVVCEEGRDCVAGRCEGVQEPDGGAGDGGPTDGGTLDGSLLDGGLGCARDEDCDDGVACTVDRCAAGACASTPEDALCRAGTTCDPVAGCPPRACDGDAECDDARACNGAERCVGAVCVAGTAVSCDDMDECTTGRCEEGASAMCVQRTRDRDGDGYGDAACPSVGGVPATDCDDSDPLVSPDATEACNGADDDCDGVCDNGFECCSGRSSACTTTCGSMGTRTCRLDCTFGAGCTPPAETCNGLDDDCDGAIDNGFDCTPPATRFCTTSCGSTGLSACDAACAWGACVPPAEVCNGVDDNCDGAVDEGCGSCAACAGATTVSAPGGRFTVPLAAHAQTGSCGGPGAEGYLTFTLAAPSDVFITTHASAGVDTVVYVRRCGCADGVEVGCNDDADGLVTSTLQLTALPAGSYNVFVDTKAPASDSVVVDVYLGAPATPSDRCGQPTFLPAGATTLSGNTCTFGADYRPAVTSECGFVGTGGANDRVYYFVLPSARTVTFNGCQAGSTYDSALYVRHVCALDGAANMPACNDDACGGMRACNRALRSSVTTTLGPGLYYLFVDGYLGGTCDCGSFELAISGL